MRFILAFGLTLAAFTFSTDTIAQTPAAPSAGGAQSLILVTYVMKDDGPVGASTTTTVIGKFGNRDACTAAANAGIYFPGPGGAKFFNWGFFCVPSGG